MKDDKINIVKKDILKSGIPLEIEISSLLRRNGWFVVHQAAYLDKDREVVRNIDILAIRMHVINLKKIKSLALVIECKKSEKPWTFYTQPKSSDFYVGLVTAIESLRKLFASKQDMGGLGNVQVLIEKSHFADMNIKVGTISYVPFAQKDDFFEAREQVTKALAYFRKQWELHLIYPVVIFDGEIYEFDIHEKEVKIEPIEYLQFIGVEKEKTLAPCLIDVVRRTYFAEFLKLINEEFDHL